MRNIILTIILLWNGFIYSQDLTTKQQREFIKQRFNVEALIETEGISTYLGYGITSGTSKTIKKWRVFRDGTLLNESTFYKIAGDDDYYKRAKRKETMELNLSLIGGIGFVVGCTAIIGSPFFLIEGDELFALWVLGVGGGLTLASSIPLGISISLYSKQATDYGTAKAIADLYNKELLIKIKKEF